jgi:hypothetical protein
MEFVGEHHPAITRFYDKPVWNCYYRGALAGKLYDDSSSFQRDLP